MKWFKHISDSLDDPFIFDLLDQFGADGYLIFFGVLEIYSREFKPEAGWQLCVTRSYLKKKFHKRQDTIIIKTLLYIATHGKLNGKSGESPGELVENSGQTRDELPAKSQETPGKVNKNLKKVIENSGKWNIAFDGEEVFIFIPKFAELIDNWTKRKLGSSSVESPKNLTPEEEEEGEGEGEGEEETTPGDFPNQEAHQFVENYIDHVLKIKGAKAPKKTKSLIKNSYRTVDLLIRIDEIPLDFLKDVMAWALGDDFWSNNVLSLAPLRKISGSNGLKKIHNIIASYEESIRRQRGAGIPTRLQNNMVAAQRFMEKMRAKNGQ